MPSGCFFLEDQLEAGRRYTLAGDEWVHAKRVTRARVGDDVVLVNGEGVSAQALVRVMDRDSLQLEVLSITVQLRPATTLILGIPFLRHIDFVVEKGVELGVDTFCLFPAERSERAEASASAQRRLRALTIAAIKQSGRAFLPKLCYCGSLQEAIAVAPRPLVWAQKAVHAQPLEQLPGESTCLSLFVGPESGWSDNEQTLLANAGPAVLLHDTILRAETAAIVGAYAGFCWLNRGINGSA